jgi:hypothetical protein
MNHKVRPPDTSHQLFNQQHDSISGLSDSSLDAAYTELKIFKQFPQNSFQYQLAQDIDVRVENLRLRGRGPRYQKKYSRTNQLENQDKL